MDKGTKLNRRAFLHISAMGAASAMLAACGPAAQPPAAAPTAAPAAAAPTTAAAAAPTAAPAAAAPTTAAAAAPTTAAAAAATAVPTTAAAASTAKESPLLAQMVKDGKLPALAERLPKNPYVVPHKWLTPGNYGGTMQWSNSWGGKGISQIVHESMYGHSPLRWLNDGLEIGPGLVEQWEKNDDASQWTLHFRNGLKWSDGQPWTVDDILYWWEDMATNPDYSEEQAALPDEARSGKGTLAQFKKVDDYTLQMIFDAPAPLTADRLAMWVNAGIGPRWMAPKHYLQQFHPKYNKDVKDFKDHTNKMNMEINPDVPVMTGWKLTNYAEGASSTWQRNPFYWCVDQAGNQLPYIDGVFVTGYQDSEVEKLNVLNGKVDWCHHWVMGLTDVAALKQAQSKSKLEVRFWDSGSGSGQAFFFCYDYVDEKMRKLIREPKFRKALSMAANRADVQKRFYFETGELTTGTFSPKAIEYTVNDEGKQSYVAWRDSAVKYDPEAAKTMLDEIGVKAGADGTRTFPDGSPLKISMDYHSNATKDTIATIEVLASNWKAIGLNADLNPVVATTWDDIWATGTQLSQADWGIGDGPNHLVYPQWLVPIEQQRWAPLEGRFYSLRGTEKEQAERDVDPWKRTPPRMEADKGGPIDQLWKIYDQTKVEPDPMKRYKMVWDMIKIHVDQGPFVQGTVANFKRVIPVSTDLRNVPKPEDLALGGFTDPWIHPTPAVYDPEAWYFDNPDEHNT